MHYRNLYGSPDCPRRSFPFRVARSRRQLPGPRLQPSGDAGGPVSTRRDGRLDGQQRTGACRPRCGRLAADPGIIPRKDGRFTQPAGRYVWRRLLGVPQGGGRYSLQRTNSAPALGGLRGIERHAGLTMSKAVR